MLFCRLYIHLSCADLVLLACPAMPRPTTTTLRHGKTGPVLPARLPCAPMQIITDYSHDHFRSFQKYLYTNIKDSLMHHCYHWNLSVSRLQFSQGVITHTVPTTQRNSFLCGLRISIRDLFSLVVCLPYPQGLIWTHYPHKRKLFPVSNNLPKCYWTHICLITYKTRFSLWVWMIGYLVLLLFALRKCRCSIGSYPLGVPWTGWIPTTYWHCVGNTQNNQGFFPPRIKPTATASIAKQTPIRTSAQYHTNSILKTVSFSPFSTGLIFNPDLPTATIQVSCSVSPCTREHKGSPKHRCNQHFGTFWKSLWTSYRRNIRQQYDKISMDVINELHTTNESLYHSLKFKKVGEFLEVFFPEKLDVFSTEILHSKFSFHNCSILPKHGYIRLMEINTPISCIRNLFELEKLEYLLFY